MLTIITVFAGLALVLAAIPYATQKMKYLPITEAARLINEIKTAQKSTVDTALILAIIDTESGFEIYARGDQNIKDDNSLGLMQVRLSTARWLGFNGIEDDLYHPEINIMYGMKYLDWLYKQFPSNFEGIIMAYNEGATNYKKGKRVTAYYNKVLSAWKKYTNK